MLSRVAASIIGILSLLFAYGQDWKKLDTDDLFLTARQEAFDKKWESAREKLNFILTSNPEHHDARILLARTYAWTHKYDTARLELKKVLRIDSRYFDAISALTDVEMWSENFEAALETVNLGLRQHPTNKDFLFKKAKIYRGLSKDLDAMAVINQLLQLYPTYEEALKFRSSLKSGKLRHDFSLRAGADFFNKKANNYQTAYYAFAQLIRNNDWGSSTIRLNYAQRFQKEGLQGEVDLYPVIHRRLYSYLNYGYSQSDLFPKHRFGAELFASFFAQFEGSLGLRHLAFEQPVTIYTASLAWYLKSMLISVRPFLTPEGTGSFLSGKLAARKYFRSPRNYVELAGGFGFSPDLRSIQTTDGLSQEEIYVLKAQRIGLDVQNQLKYNWVFRVNLNLTHQEISPTDYIFITRLLTTFTYRF